MRWSEAAAIVRAHRVERGAQVAEVRRLAARKPRFVDRSGVLSAALATVVLGTSAILIGPKLLASSDFGNVRATTLRPAPSALANDPHPRTLIMTRVDGKILCREGDPELKTSGSLWTYPPDEKTDL